MQSTGDDFMRVCATFTHGYPLDFREGELVHLPPELVEGHELVIRVVRKGVTGWNVQRGDLLTVEQRPGGKAATGELVLAAVGRAVYLGRWWNKRGRRALLDVRMQPVIEGPGVKVFGAVILVTRDEHDAE